ncbi:MAG: isoleucine--tRNA ligase [Deltaproteobacteria bacterium]|jgi:isoleucyl-tRNA synthetase|nr:isoleucine--tRNA ligase [Deltaproteobacteria bacterium]
MSDYKHTLNLPRTDFPMRANLTQREPALLKFWEENDAYAAMLAAAGGKGAYVLHDGPPYANGNIHLGTALNKILKDIIIKSRNLAGETARYVPGWDCHGLPIEHKVEQELAERKKDLPPNVVRRICRDYAHKWIKVQREEFRRLGVFGDWDNPYLSMHPEYEATTALELAGFVERGAVQRSKKPIHWCASCHTALAEAEVEYYDLESPSIYVGFPLPDPRLAEVIPGADPLKAQVIIWTTTPWTIPDNLAIALHPDFDYVLVRAETDSGAGGQYILARELLEPNAGLFGWKKTEELAVFKGAALEGLRARHPFYDRDSPLILGGHVTLESGTGAVHTAPGHGREDYEAGVRYGLDILSPLDDAGRFHDSVPFFGGLNVFEANPGVEEKLREKGLLLASSRLRHSYPHCWRCKKPVFFRATTQWFIMMEAGDLRRRTLEAIRRDVRWIPAWGEERIYNMIENRPDWCISRQRTWGVPILALLCENCGEAWQEPAWMREVAGRFATHPTGCDYWFETEARDLVPPGLTCPHCGHSRWKKESDILDVWFDSGTSWAAVLEKRPECVFPADLYLEGSDQHRGWFHSSLLASMSRRLCPPYRAVLTHGYVVDGEGRKMSKSGGNVVSPQEVIARHGAEVLRLWVASVDYREDIRYSDEIVSRLIDAYRRIRNTCRYLLGNLHDFSPAAALPPAELDPLDRFALDTARRVHLQARKDYLGFEFHKVFHSLHNFCVTDLSAFYLDVLKDRLYSYAPAGRERRSAQTALDLILRMLLLDMAPVLSFTAEEAFQSLPEKLRPGCRTVFALPEPDLSGLSLPQAGREAWENLLRTRGAVTRAIEPLRRDGRVGHALDTSVTLYAGEELAGQLRGLGTDLRAAFIVSQLEIKPLPEAGEGVFSPEEQPDLKIGVSRARGEKCGRCWVYSEEPGKDPRHPDLCPRCAAVLGGQGARC